MNLLRETLDVIRSLDYTPEDIIFIGSPESGYCCTWDQFVTLADREYDNGYGAQKVASDLEIIFLDGARMQRDEYGGSEGWHFCRKFSRPENPLPIKSLFVSTEMVGWETLQGIHEDLGDD